VRGVLCVCSWLKGLLRLLLNLGIEVGFNLGEACVEGSVFGNECFYRIGYFLERVSDLGANGAVNLGVHFGVQFFFKHFGDLGGDVVRVYILCWLGHS